MSDLISRQAAIKALCENGMCGEKNCNAFPCEDVKAIMRVPTIEPVKDGSWIFDDFGFHCSECWAEYPSEITDELNYCPNCGARMGDDWEEPEINPCRGCDDYDGRGGCKSHGGCGAERSEDDKTAN